MSVNKIYTPKLNLLIATLVCVIYYNNIEINILNKNNTNLISIDRSEATAKSRGGRSSGGSFSRRSSRSSNSNRSTSSGRSNNSSVHIHNYHGVSVYPYGYGYRYGYGYGYFNLLTILIVLGILGAIAFFIVSAHLSSKSQKKNEVNKELSNNIVTISKLQVALLAEAKIVSRDLSEITLNIDTSTSQGLYELLQESILVLLRNAEYWSHVQSNSFSLNIDKAESNFQRLSIEERSKFSSETLTNVDGQIRSKEFEDSTDKDKIAAYIVITLLIGTEDDRSLFSKIRSTEDLKAALEKLASIPQDYLLRCELLWTPQKEDDCMTYDELLTEYKSMIQIA
jgi:uncharacterized membrane protein